MIAIVAVSLCHIAAGVFLNKLAPVRPQAPSQNGEQLSSQKTPKKNFCHKQWKCCKYKYRLETKSIKRCKVTFFKVCFLIEHIYPSVLSIRYSKHIGQNRIET